jgi:hypothetical protein
MAIKIVWSRSIGFNLELNGMEKFSPGTWKPMEITGRIHDGCDCYPWMEVLAWWPVKTVSGKYVWLRKIYKRKFWVIWGAGFHMEPIVEYGTLFDVIKSSNDE